jgi:DNA polymerase-3 subunit alpha (Gram-positive type)
MDDFLNYLIKKSDINNNEFFNYKTYKKPVNKSKPIVYNKIKEPTYSSYVVFDFETTGVNRQNSAIIEIGAVKVVDNKPIDKFSQLVNPQQFIPYFITSKVHIDNAMVANMPTIENVLPRFIEFMGDYTLVAHNASFDMSFLLNAAMQLCLPLKNPVIDTLSLSRRYNKECERHSLEYLTNYFNVKLDNAHRAYFDALATHELYQIIRAKYLQNK